MTDLVFEEQFKFFQTLLQSLLAGLCFGMASITSLCLAFLEEVVIRKAMCSAVFLSYAFIDCSLPLAL